MVFVPGDVVTSTGLKPDVSTGEFREELPVVSYPTAWCRINLKLEDFGQPDPNDLISLQYIPLTARVVLNSFDEADTFNVKIDFEEFPLDPRVIEGATCEVFMASADSLDPDFWLRQSTDFFRAHCVITGVIDLIKTGIGPQGRITELKGRDYTAYFLDAQTDANPISYLNEKGEKLTFVEVIELILAQRETTEAITIRDKDQIEKIYPKDYKSGADDKDTGKRKKKPKETIWEAVRDIAIEAGHLIYVDLDEIVIRKPRTIFIGAPQDQSSWLRWTVGFDILSFHPERKMGREQGIRVRVTSFDDRTHKAIEAHYPEKGFTKLELKAAKVAGTTETTVTKTLKFRSYVFRNITSKIRLQEIAKQLYTLVSHYELEGNFNTSEMFDSNGREVWGIRYGDPITFDVAESLASIISLGLEEQIKILVEYGYGEKAARALMLSIDQAGVPFYIHNIEHDFSSEDEGGYEMTAQIRSRRQVDPDNVSAPGPED